MKVTVAQAIVECLKQEKIEYAFGISGSHYLSFFDALKDSKIKFISVKHESTAGFMALNYTKVSQKPALILGTAGPGAANLVNGVAELFKNNIPAIVITPMIPSMNFGKNGFQEDTGMADSYSVNRLFEPVTRKSIQTNRPDLTIFHLHELLRYMLNPPYGPVHLSVPSDFFTSEIDALPAKPNQYRTVHDERTETGKITELADLISKSRLPVILTGKRCVYPNCAKTLQEIIDLFSIPFIGTYGSKGLLSEHQNMFGGILDYFGHRSAEIILKSSDTILALGMDFSESETIKYDGELFSGKSIVSLDTHPLLSGINFQLHLGIIGELNASLRLLKKQLQKIKCKKLVDEEMFQKDILKYNSFQNEEMKKASPLQPPYIYDQISRFVKSKTSMVFVDTGASSFASTRHFYCQSSGFYASGSGYSMGQGISGVIGGKLAHPASFAISVGGDGAFLMSGNEILTALQYDLGITWIIFKDDLLNMVNLNQELIYNDLQFCVTIKNPDFRYLAKAYNIEYYEIKKAADIKKCLEKAYNRQKQNLSSLILVHYDSKDCLPLKPRMVKVMEEFGQTKNLKTTPALMRALKKVIKEKT